MLRFYYDDKDAQRTVQYPYTMRYLPAEKRLIDFGLWSTVAGYQETYWELHFISDDEGAHFDVKGFRAGVQCGRYVSGSSLQRNIVEY